MKQLEAAFVCSHYDFIACSIAIFTCQSTYDGALCMSFLASVLLDMVPLGCT